MRLEGKTYKDNYTLRVVVAEHTDDSLRFTSLLEACLLNLCKQLDIAPPLWMERNTHEFAAWHQTVFHEEQFMEKVPFSRLQIKWLDDGRSNE